MINVEQLSKHYTGVRAVDRVSFSVDEGETVGFLGPNGAGKTTTLRMLAGFIPPTAGHAEVGGFDVFTDSLEVRRRIGYLPEQVPLYPEFRVDEYLSLRAQMRGMRRREIRERLEEVTLECGLEEVASRIIGQLSKGFRQRVGIADALFHQPGLLILDEPTIGLDPNQIRHFRDLLNRLRSRHTILISTHILSEVEMTCDRLLIMHRGQIVASERKDDLAAGKAAARTLFLLLDRCPDGLLDALEKIEHVASARRQETSQGVSIQMNIKSSADPRDAVFHAVVEQGAVIREMKLEKQSLEDIFRELTS